VISDGEITWACRCEYHDCAKYKECFTEFRSWQAVGGAQTEVKKRDKITEHGRKSRTLKLPEQTEEETAELWKEGETAAFSESAELAGFDVIEDYVMDERYDEMLFAPASVRAVLSGGAGSGKTFAVNLRREILRGRNALFLSPQNFGGFLSEHKDLAGLPPQTALAACERRFGSFCSVLIDDAHLITPEQAEIINILFKYITGELWSEVRASGVTPAATSLGGEKISEVVTCGYLVAGNFGLISDFSCFEKFFEIIHADRNCKKYNLGADYRGKTGVREIAELIKKGASSEIIRTAAGFCDMSLEQLLMSPENFSEICAEGETTAVICLNPGEAEAVSTLLRGHGIGHRLAGRRVPGRALADMFHDYAGNEVSKNMFAELYTSRVNRDTAAAYALFGKCMEYCGRRRSNILRLDELKKNIAAYGGERDELRKITVAYVKNVYGEEFDNVYVPEPRVCDSLDLYNSVTRARGRYIFLKKDNPADWEFSKSDVQQSENGGTPLLYQGSPVCRKILIDGGADSRRFISDNDEGGAGENQLYIAKQVKRGDPVEIRRGYAREYLISHYGRVVGRMKDDFADTLEGIALSAEHASMGGAAVIPSAFSDVYVDRVITEAGASSEHSHSGFWLGIRVFGMAEATYDYYN